MLDTLKLGIPLTKTQYKRICDVAAKADRWQWVLCNQSTGELRFRRVAGLASTDGYSYHRELRWEIPQTYSPDCKLLLEFSVPKYWYGHNIRLLYDFVEALSELKRLLERQFELKGRGCLLGVSKWLVLRVDVCYAWKFPSQQLAQQFLDSLKRLHFPRKSPVIYPTSILFKGNTYTVKFYLKAPEFKAHDRKELLKANAALEWVEYLECLADGVLRVEATLRYRYLKRHDIKTVADLARPLIRMDLDEQLIQLGEESQLAIDAIMIHNSELFEAESEDEFYSQFRDGDYLTMPVGETLYTLNPDPSATEPIAYKHGGGGIKLTRQDNPTAILQSLLIKFVGDGLGMQQADEIKTKLLEVYKPVKAARLVSFWLYVQRFGSSEAKEAFGKDSYYYNKREMKKAGVSLIDPPSGSTLTVTDKDFMRRFKLAVPSEDVTNKFDDFREKSNILNFVPRMSGRIS